MTPLVTVVPFDNVPFAFVVCSVPFVFVPLDVPFVVVPLLVPFVCGFVRRS